MTPTCCPRGRNYSMRRSRPPRRPGNRPSTHVRCTSRRAPARNERSHRGNVLADMPTGSRTPPATIVIMPSPDTTDRISFDVILTFRSTLPSAHAALCNCVLERGERYGKREDRNPGADTFHQSFPRLVWVRVICSAPSLPSLADPQMCRVSWSSE